MDSCNKPMQNPKDISDPTTTIDMALVLMAKAFTLNDTTPTNNNQRSSLNPCNMQIAQQVLVRGKLMRANANCTLEINLQQASHLGY
ncbi:hypothetical protein Tco_0565266 [Tanacetum coccineum]